MVTLPRRQRPVSWRVDQYRGQKHLDVTATQLSSQGVAKPSEQRRILHQWIEFFGSGPTRITELNLVSRVPQDLLDALAGQTQLKRLHVKWGPYTDLTPLKSLTTLKSLSLGGATKVDDLTPLTSLHALRELAIDQPYSVRELGPLGELRSLRSLFYGNGSLGSDKVVTVDDLRWIRSLTNLRTIQLPGTRLPPEELKILLELPRLTALSMPLRRGYRQQVLDYAPRSKAFAGVAKSYEELDTFKGRVGSE